MRLFLYTRYDPFTPMDEIVRAFNYLIDTGKTFYWATSEWPVERIMEACEVADKLNLVKPIADQCEYSLIVRDNLDKAYHSVFEKFGYGTTIWSPLGSGVLTGKYLDGNVPEGSRMSLKGFEGLGNFYLTEENLKKVADMKPIAERLGCSLTQLSLGFCYVNPHVSTVILGATSVKQLEENLATLKIVEKLTPEVIQEIEAIWQNKPGPSRTEQMVFRVRA
uniref:NADP-dependent oxidoreductase domain-containing protein n=1 Tax=Rhodosorus marinus TaxID=101924 RepID=A0A7S3A9R0_9RHOD|mmetsp:Transcript_8387/g.37500  ORF Transcript_8387/g.37500 Transcript_8387/m.37500 type:complete len:221 (+) Transcript_8387:647-1309(+)